MYSRTVTTTRNAVRRLQQIKCCSSASDKDPASLFFDKDVQKLLQRITGFNLQKIFHSRPTKDFSSPKYNLMTDEELRKVQEQSVKRGVELLQMPPFLKPRVDKDIVLSEDPEIEGLIKYPIVFTDITYQIPHHKRTIVVREQNGKLRLAKHSECDRMLQMYFPEEGKAYRVPEMFQADNLEKVLTDHHYEYVLDRACVQFEPDDPEFLRVTHRTYEHVAQTTSFDVLRSTRHFGTMAFYFIYYRRIDELLVDMLQRDLIEDAGSLVKLYYMVHPQSNGANQSVSLNHPIDLIKLFLKHDCTRSGPVELALQSYQDHMNSANTTKTVQL